MGVKMIVILDVAIRLLLLCFLAVVFQFSWNSVIVYLFGLPMISWFQSLLFIFMVRLLFK